LSLRGVVGICDLAGGGGNTGWSWGDGVHLGDHSWDASGDVARSQGDRWGGGGVDGCRVGGCSIGGCAIYGSGGAVGIHWVRCWGRTGHGASVCSGRAVGHLRSAGGDGVNDGCALMPVS
jgi:hypothetical protein